MLKALESLPWARSAVVDYSNKQATVTVVSKNYEEKALLTALKSAGFGGSVVAKAEKTGDEEPATKAPKGERVAFHVTGMMKTKSGAT